MVSSGKPMGGSVPTIFTDEVLGKIPEWIASGVPREDIAEALGTTPGALAVVCSNKGISLRRPLPARAFVPELHAILRCRLHASSWSRICDVARQRRQSAGELVLALLGHIATDDLFRAVLDEDGDADDSG